MGEISFRYNTILEPKHEFQFRYWFETSIEYSFAYQRYVAFSDASIFNSPVAITKVATGLSQLYDLFVDKRSHPMAYFNLIHDFNKIEHDSTDKTLSFASKTDIETKCNNTLYRITRPYSFFLNTYSDISSLQKNESTLKTLLQGAWLLTEDIAHMYETYGLKERYENQMQFYKDMYSMTRDMFLDVHKDFFTSPTTIHANIYKNPILRPKYEKISNVLNQYLVTPFDKHANIFDNKYAKQSMPIVGNVIQQLYLHRNIDNNAVINDDILGQSNGKQVVIPPSELLYKQTKKTNMLNFTELTKAQYNMQKILTADGITKPINKGFYQQEFAMYIYNNPLSIFGMNTFSVREQRQTFMVQPHFVYSSSKNLHVNTEYNIIKQDNEMITQESFWFDVIDNGLIVPNTIFLQKEKLLSGYNNKIQPISIIHKKIDYLYEGYYVDKYTGKMSLSTYLFMEKDKASLFIVPNTVWTEKVKNGIPYIDTGLWALRDSSKMDIQDFSVIVNKDNQSMSIYKTDSDIYKNNVIASISSKIWTSKDMRDVMQSDFFMAEKSKQMAAIYRKMHSALKQKIIADTLNIESVIKYRIPADYANTLHNNFGGMIIPISKVRHQSYIDTIDSKVRKLATHGYLNSTLSVSVIPENTNIQTLDLFCDKKEHETFLEYKNMHISKAKVRGLILKNEFITKSPVRTRLEGLIWTDKVQTKTFTTDSIWAEKQANKVQIHSLIDVTIGSRDIYCHNTLFVDKIDRLCYYDYGMTWTDKTLEAQLFNQLHVDRAKQDLHMLDCVSPFIKKELDAFYDYGVFGNKIIQESALFKEMSTMQKCNKDCGLHPNDFGNWAWVYETPDPFDGISYGIDELLLPENDTRYEGFEDIVFNKETMMPRNPVKQIDENTFIAKYPIRHPLSSKYTNVAVDYDKSAINLENYYGIETRIVHTVFLKFYRIWQSKIFEFGTMTMVQSVKLILEYLYSWIMEYFPLEEIEQALRVFKLIRWYGESSIIQNSQYIISYEYGLLESKLNTGTCMIPNNLGPDNGNLTMYVDSKLGVIRNDPAYLGISNAYVEFYINNKKNTTFTFSLSNTVGSVNIYINEVLVDTVSKSALNLTYELPYTGDISIVKIEKEASNNLNATFYIGNIKVPNGTFKELSIEFDPTLKAGNKPLNEIAKKMIAAANLYEDREEAYDVIRKGNLGVSELYKKLEEYWELHHQGKSKGKRLTIKEV